MRPCLLWVLLAGLGFLPCGAPAETRDAAAPTTAPTTAPAVPPVLDDVGRDLVRRMKEAEARNGFRRMICDDAGRIRTLFLSSTTANDENVRAAAFLPDLNAIRIYCSYRGISAEAIGELNRLDHLEKLELRYANHTITLQYGMALAKITSLRALALSNSDVDAQVLPLLSALPHLTTLELKSCRDLTDADLTALTQMRQLENLDLSFTTVSSASLDVLATLPHLKRLIITGTGITEDDVQLSKLAGKVVVKGAKQKLPEPDAL